MQIFQKIEFSTLAWFFLRNANAFFCYIFPLLLRVAPIPSSPRFHFAFSRYLPSPFLCVVCVAIFFILHRLPANCVYYARRSVSSKFIWVQSPFVSLPIPLPTSSSPPVCICVSRASCFVFSFFSRVEMNIFFIRCVHIFFRFILFVIIRFCSSFCTFVASNAVAQAARAQGVSARQHGCEEYATEQKMKFCAKLIFQ